jgi:hypothetical protein
MRLAVGLHISATNANGQTRPAAKEERNAVSHCCFALQNAVL